MKDAAERLSTHAMNFPAEVLPSGSTLRAPRFSLKRSLVDCLIAGARRVRRHLPQILILSVVFLIALTGRARADNCWTVFVPPDSFQTVCVGSGGGGSGGGGGAPPPGACTPGTIGVETVVVGGEVLCEVWQIWRDVCTGEIVFAQLVSVLPGGSCSAGDPGQAQLNPCAVLSISGSGVYCQTGWGIESLLEASVSFPQTFLDLRPFPATLVRWPSAARNGGQPQAAGVGILHYIGYGGGVPADPETGDWRGVRLKLELLPAGPLFFSMPKIGAMALPDMGPRGTPAVFQWEVPSHPAAGGDVLAGQVSGFGELPPEMPVFAGAAQSPYRLFWSLSYEVFVRECEPGPHPLSGQMNCKTNNSQLVNDGHWVNEWQDRGQGGEITPQMVIGLPAGLAADLDGDGVAEAFWNRNVLVRRMDDANRVDNPQWQASWSWAGSVYWAVREGQAQVGWP